MEHATDLESPYLRNYFADLRSLTGAARTLFGELSGEQWSFKPGPTVWCVAECFAHLSKTAELYHPRIAAAVGEVRTETEGIAQGGITHGGGSAPPFKPRWIQRRFIAMVGPESHRRVKTFKIFAPSAARIDPAEVEREFLARQQELAELMARADGLDLHRGRIVSPLTRLLVFNLGEVFWLLTAHGQRHLLQAQRLCRTPGFPAS